MNHRTERTKEVRRKGETTVVCPTVEPSRRCRRRHLPPCIKISLKSKIFRFRVDSLGYGSLFVLSNFVVDLGWLSCSYGIMSYRRNNFLETDDMFLEFEDDLDNIAGGSSSVGDNARSSSQPPATLTPKRRAQSQLLKLECHVTVNGRISMTIAPEAIKPIFPHVVRFRQAIGWADVGRGYIEVVKGDLQRFFVLDFNDQAMNTFVEHQMLTIFKEFRGDCHRHFKKYSDPEEARANPQNEQSRTNKAVDRNNLTITAAGQSHFYNDSTSSMIKNGSRSTMWSCFEKHTFEPGQSNAGTLVPAYPRG
uniref:CACTA en-spm transposon protein n=1 Tax=Cucumis melo TaxID=3656 RepID=A0A9I9EIS6_CUCME